MLVFTNIQGNIFTQEIFFVFFNWEKQEIAGWEWVALHYSASEWKADVVKKCWENINLEQNSTKNVNLLENK